MLVVVIIVVEEKTLGLFHGRCGPFFIFWCSRCNGNKKKCKKIKKKKKNKHMLVKKEKLMAQTTTKHRLGLFHGPFDSFPGVDGVGSGAVVVLVNNVSIIIIKNMIKNIPGAASRAPVVVIVVIGVPFSPCPCRRRGHRFVILKWWWLWHGDMAVVSW